MDVRTAVEGRVDSGEVHGAAWLVDRAGDVSTGAAGISATYSLRLVKCVIPDRKKMSANIVRPAMANAGCRTTTSFPSRVSMRACVLQERSG